MLVALKGISPVR